MQINRVAAISLVCSYLALIALPISSDSDSLQFMVWRLLCALIFTIAILLGIPLWRWMIDLRRSIGMDDVIPAAVEIAGVVFFGAWLFTSRMFYAFLPQAQSTPVRLVMGGLIVVCFGMVALPSTLWMVLCRKAFLRLPGQELEPMDRAHALVRLRDRARLVGAFTAGGIAAATLPLGAWRRLVLTRDHTLAAAFPPETVILFGLYWSFFLATSYVSVHLAFLQAGESIGRCLLPPSPAGTAEFLEWEKQRQGVDAYLGLDRDPVDSMRIIFAVLAPLVAAIVSTMMSGPDKG